MVSKVLKWDHRAREGVFVYPSFLFYFVNPYLDLDSNIIRTQQRVFVKQSACYRPAALRYTVTKFDEFLSPQGQKGFSPGTFSSSNSYVKALNKRLSLSPRGICTTHFSHKWRFARDTDAPDHFALTQVQVEQVIRRCRFLRFSEAPSSWGSGTRTGRVYFGRCRCILNPLLRMTDVSVRVMCV